MKYTALILYGLLTVLLVTLCSFPGPAHAGEYGNGRPSACANIPLGPRSDACHEWVRTARIPGTESSCCGEGDTYVADEWEVIDGELWMTITADYPPPQYMDDEGNPIPIPEGTFVARKGLKVHIPKEKLITRFEDRNRSPHGVIYMNLAGVVYCASLGAQI